MGLIRRILGPRSKYVKELPFTYEARVEVTEGAEITNTFLSDTICGLVEHLRSEGVDPSQVEIREVYQAGETLIDQALYTSEDGQWLARPAMCRSFEAHYPGHVRDGECTFSDRDKTIAGE
jgi:hypothetical protein